MSAVRFALHGGAGVIDREAFGADREAAYRESLAGIARRATMALNDGALAIDVVEQAVKELEDCPFFNAGHGAVLNRDGLAELDASIMNGRDRSAGAVGSVFGVRNPIAAAREVMRSTEHVMLVGPAADAFARARGLCVVGPEYFQLPERLRQLQLAQQSDRITLDHDESYERARTRNSSDKSGTVGAVARDLRGTLAAATSTGGMTNKLPGRLGDAPIIGAGTWADDRTCAVSATGHGEYFMRCAVAFDIHSRMRYGNISLQQAAEATLQEVAEMGGTGGVIAIDRDGSMTLPFNSPGMYRAWSYGNSIHVGIFPEDGPHG